MGGSEGLFWKKGVLKANEMDGHSRFVLIADYVTHTCALFPTSF